MNYEDLGLTKNFRSKNGLGDNESLDIKGYIDKRINEVTKPGGLNFQGLKNSALGYQAVVAKDNAGGAFTNIQDAINYVDTLGGGSIFIKGGTYFISSSITMNNNIRLVGEGVDSTILDYTNNTSINSDAFLITGTLVSDDGTISVTNGDSTITGSSTTFSTDSVADGDTIMFDNVFYTVDSVTNNTSLEIKETYKGETASGINFVICKPIKACSFSNMTIKNNNSGGSQVLNINYTKDVSVENVLFKNNFQHVFAINSINLSFIDCSFSGGTQGSPRFCVDIGASSGNSSMSCVFYGCSFFNNQSGLRVRGQASMTVKDCLFIHNDETSFVVLTDDIIVSNCHFLRNTRAMNFTTGASENVVDSCYFSDNGTAIAQGVGANSNSFVGCVFNGNRQGITIDGTTATPGWNNVAGCYFLGTGDILNITSGALGWNVVGNDFISGTLNNLGTTSLVSSNFGVMDNTSFSGMGTISSGATTGTFNHTLTKTPDSVQVTPTTVLGSSSSFYVSSAGTGNFVVTLNTDPGQDVVFNLFATRVFT